MVRVSGPRRARTTASTAGGPTTAADGRPPATPSRCCSTRTRSPPSREYLSVGVLDVSPDGNWLAYAVDHAGDERHALRFRDLAPATRPTRSSPTSPTGSPGPPTPPPAGTRSSTTPSARGRPPPRRGHRARRRRRGPPGDRRAVPPPVGAVAQRRGRGHRRGQRRSPARAWLLDAAPAARSAGAGRRARAGRRVLGGPPPDRAADHVEPRRRRGLRPLARRPRPAPPWRRGTSGSRCSPTGPAPASSGVEAFAGHLVVQPSHRRPHRPLAARPRHRRRPRRFEHRRAGGHGRPGNERRVRHVDLPVQLPVARRRRRRCIDEDLATGERTCASSSPCSAASIRRTTRRRGSGPRRTTAPAVPISLVWRPDRGAGRRSGAVPALRLRRLRGEHGPVVLDVPPVAARPGRRVRHRPRARRRRARPPLVRGRQVRPQGQLVHRLRRLRPPPRRPPAGPRPSASRHAAAAPAGSSWARWPTWRPSCSGPSWPRCRSSTR